MPINKKAVGRHIYVWSTSQSGALHREAVISSHGGAALMNGMKGNGVPNCKLAFYGPHGYALKDPSVASVIAGIVRPLETLAVSESPDYRLEKYQNSAKTIHSGRNGVETYEWLETLDTVEFPKSERSGRSVRNNAPRWADHYQRGVGMDIITIRSRNFGTPPKLSGVLKELWANGYVYDKIHCCFCRGDGEAVLAQSIPGDYVTADRG